MERLIEKKAFLLLLIVVSLAFFWLLLPYYSAVFWGTILAILFSPLQRRLADKFGGRHNLAALTTLLICLFIVIIPVIFIAASLVQEGASLYQRIRSGDLDLGSYVEQARMALPPTAEQWLERAGVATSPPCASGSPRAPCRAASTSPPRRSTSVRTRSGSWSASA